MQSHFSTKAALAKALGTSRPNLDKYLAMDGAPKIVKGKGWPFESILAFIGEHAARAESQFAGNNKLRSLKEKEVGLRCERIQFNLDTDRAKVIATEMVKSWLIGAIEKQKYILSLKLKNELPPKLEGLRAAEIAAKMEPLIADICQCLQTLKF